LVNVLSSNRDSELVEAWLQNENPAVVGVLELQDFWARFFGSGELRAAYPFRHEAPEPGDAGVALYSRFPIHFAETIKVGRGGTPMVRAELVVDGCIVQVLVLNAFPPISQAMWSSREELLRAAAEALDQDLPTLIVGGFNATMYSSTLAEFRESANVTDSRQGIGRQATWMPVFGPLGLDIDHVLVSRDLRVRSRRVGATVGSDHAPIVSDVVLTESACFPPSVPSDGSDSAEQDP
jgi:endonuclease/exonuclease/phosphatase (EEP) superfamily protein YafD